MFMVETYYNVDALTELNFVLRKTLQKTKVLVEIGINAGILLITLGAAAVFTDSRQQWPLWVVVGVVVVLLTALRQNGNKQNLRRRLSRRSYGKGQHENAQVRFVFKERQFSMVTPTEKGTIPYDRIVAAYETPEYFILAPNRSQGYVLRKSGFYQGEPEEFSTFLARRLSCGAPIFIKT